MLLLLLCKDMKKIHSGAKRTAQWVKHLPCKWENRNLHHKGGCYTAMGAVTGQLGYPATDSKGLS